MASKRPSFQFYPGDWLRSTDLRSCSVGARGLWIDMICLMHEGNPYGHLKVGDKVILPVNLAMMVGATLEEVTKWLEELEKSGVFSVKNGCIVCRRMIRDERIRESRASGGVLGGNPALLKRGKVNLPANLPPTPAVAFASASSSSKPKNKAQANGFELPEWVPKMQWDAWIESRTKARKAPTPFAKRMAVSKLEQLHEQGHHPAAVLAQSAFNGWAGLFPIKEQK